MNLFQDYHNKFLEFLIILKINKTIEVSEDLKGLIVEAAPKEYMADISFNAAMILSKLNKKTPLDLANTLKKYFTENFLEFEKITVAKPGFLNFNFKNSFWKNHLINIINFKSRYGSNKYLKKKYNIEFVSANPTGPLHIGHCRGAVLGDVISNLLKFNGHSVVKEYYVNDYGNQVNSFVLSVYYRILQIIKKQPFPINKNLYPGDYIIDIAKNIIEEKNITKFNNLDEIYEKLTIESEKPFAEAPCKGFSSETL